MPLQPGARFDLPAYLARIGFAGTPRPDAATLRELCRLHPMAIPFENVSPLTGAPVPLEIGALQAKMIGARRGGYCFEHNTLLAHALAVIGFPVTGLSARVRWNVPEDRLTPHTHMMLRVAAGDGDWLVDAGFGGVTLTAPLRLDRTGADQETPHGTFRLEEDGADLLLTLRLPEGARPVIRFNLERRHAPDFEMANYYVSTLPESRFRNELVVSRPVPGGRLVLHNRVLTEYGANGETKRTLSPAEIEAAMRERFGVEISDRAAFRRAIEALPQ